MGRHEGISWFEHAGAAADIWCDMPYPQSWYLMVTHSFPLTPEPRIGDD
jgi:hypothetical protein